MIIIIGNQKGGVGKTTHGILLANFLTIIKKEELVVLDTDFQESFKTQWENDGAKHDFNVFKLLAKQLNEYPALTEELEKITENGFTIQTFIDVLNKHDKDNESFQQIIGFAESYSWESRRYYQVISGDIRNYSELIEEVKKMNKKYIIIDLPGRLDDTELFKAIYRSADLVITPFLYDEITFRSTEVFTGIVNYVNPDVPIVFIPTKTKPSVRYELKQGVMEILQPFGKVSEEIQDKIAFQRLNTLTIPNEILETITKVYEPIYNEYLK